MNGVTVLGDRYEVGGALGHGGMAEVRGGMDTRLGRAVAIKLLHPGFAARAEMRERFQAEARAAAALNHPNIVSVFDSGEDRGTPYIVMERLPGATLADELAGGKLASARVRLVLEDVLSALATAHAAGILHRDIKPGNILHSNSGDAVKVADFGIAKTMDAGYTRTGEILGTLAYLSPERVGGAAASIADDLYAVGVVGYEALMGHPPFIGDNLGALARAIMDDTPPPISAGRPDVEPSVVFAINRAMARTPQQRFGSAADMLAAVRGNITPGSTRQAVTTPRRPGQIRPPTKVLDTSFIGPPASMVYVPPPRRRMNRRTKALCGAGIAIAALTTAIAFALDSPAPTPQLPAPAPTTTSETTPPTSTSLAPPVIPDQAPTDRQPPGKSGHGNGNGKKEHKG